MVLVLAQSGKQACLSGRLTRTKSAPEVFIAGGGSLYAQGFPYSSRFYRRLVHEKLEDARRLEQDQLAGWSEVHFERREKGSDGFLDQT